MSTIRQKTIEGLKAGDTFSVSRTFSEQDVIRFADISRDDNPVHLSKRFAKTKNFDGRICHGLLVGTLLTEIGGQIGWLATEMRFAFKKPVYFGDTVTCDFTITDIDHKARAKAEVRFTNGDGVIVLTADITGILPGAPEKEIMKNMLTARNPENSAHQ